MAYSSRSENSHSLLSMSDEMNSEDYDFDYEMPLSGDSDPPEEHTEGEGSDEGDGDVNSQHGDEKHDSLTNSRNGGEIAKSPATPRVTNNASALSAGTGYPNLSITSPADSARGSPSEWQDEDNVRPTSHGKGSSRTSWPTNRRSSNQTDATPRFQNTTRLNSFDIPEDGSEEEEDERPPVPYEIERSNSIVRQQPADERSLSSFISNNNRSSSANNGSTVSFHISAGDASVSSQSQVTQSYAGASTSLTPSSHLGSTSYVRKTPEMARHAMYKVAMDGAIQPIPFSPENSKVSIASTMFSQSNTHSPVNRKKGFTSSFNQDQDDNPLGGGSNHSGNTDAERYPPEGSKDGDLGSVDDENDTDINVKCFGIFCPHWISVILRAPPSLNRMAHCVVSMIPCFWCCGKSTTGRSTDREVLTRLNILCLFMAFAQLCAAIWLGTVLLVLDDEPRPFVGFAPHFWNLNGAAFSVGILGFILIVTCLCTIRVIKEVDLVGAIRYLWVVLWLVPFEIFFNISLYDYHRVTAVWISHWWLEPQMAWFRDYFCQEGTAETKCLVPILGGEDFSTADAWCLANYNATDCFQIQEQAQKDMESVMLTFYTALAVWGSVLLFLMLLMVDSLERIISKPIVQKSRETNVPAWLSLPTMTNALVGSILLFSPSSVMSSGSGAVSSWIGVVYLVAAALFLIALITGWFLSAYSIRNHGDKRTKNVAVVILITVMLGATLLLATIFVASILFSANLLSESPVSQSQRGEVACVVDRSSTCTQCDAIFPSQRCPEWTLKEVTVILQAQLKQSATLASIFILYAISVFRFGVTLRKHLSRYQIDYV